MGALEREGLSYFFMIVHVSRMKACEFNYYHAPDAMNLSELKSPGFLGYEKTSLAHGIRYGCTEVGTYGRRGGCRWSRHAHETEGVYQTLEIV